MFDQMNVSETSTQELAQALESGEQIQVVDVRAPMHVATGRIEPVPDERFHNIVGSQLINCQGLESTAIDRDIPVAVVCGNGNDSRVLALHLRRSFGAMPDRCVPYASTIKLVIPADWMKITMCSTAIG